MRKTNTKGYSCNRSRTQYYALHKGARELIPHGVTSQGLSEQAVPLMTAQEIKQTRDEEIISFEATNENVALYNHPLHCAQHGDGILPSAGDADEDEFRWAPLDYHPGPLPAFWATAGCNHRRWCDNYDGYPCFSGAPAAAGVLVDTDWCRLHCSGSRHLVDFHQPCQCRD
jgi:hypothetical protein